MIPCRLEGPAAPRDHEDAGPPEHIGSNHSIDLFSMPESQATRHGACAVHLLTVTQCLPAWLLSPSGAWLIPCQMEGPAAPINLEDAGPPMHIGPIMKHYFNLVYPSESQATRHGACAMHKHTLTHTISTCLVTLALGGVRQHTMVDTWLPGRACLQGP